MLANAVIASVYDLMGVRCLFDAASPRGCIFSGFVAPLLWLEAFLDGFCSERGPANCYTGDGVKGLLAEEQLFEINLIH